MSLALSGGSGLLRSILLPLLFPSPLASYLIEFRGHQVKAYGPLLQTLLSGSPSEDTWGDWNIIAVIHNVPGQPHPLHQQMLCIFELKARNAEMGQGSDPGLGGPWLFKYFPISSPHTHYSSPHGSL